MTSQTERIEFSKRLQKALSDAKFSPTSPTLLAREFNLHFKGPPVTVQAARRWLLGESIPTQEKLRALAEWLYVPTDWLRFGVLDDKAASAEGGLGSVFEPKAIAILKRLDDYNKSLAEAFIFMLDEQQKKI